MTTLLQRYELKFKFKFMLLAQEFLPCVKDLDKFHEPQMVALAPPTYVRRVWIEACTYAWIRNVGE
jgi:hypothetical protein